MGCEVEGSYNLVVVSNTLDVLVIGLPKNERDGGAAASRLVEEDQE